MRSKVIGYIRVSTEEQATGGVSLEAQRAKLEQFCSLYDLDLVDVVTDAGLSATSLDRPGLSSALARLQAGEAEGLLVAKLDRLTRRVRHLSDLLEMYFGTKFALHSVAEKIDTSSAAGRMILNIMMAVSEWEVDTLRERTSAALQHKIAVGEKVGAPAFGAKVVEGRLAEVEAELAVIDRIISEREEGNTWQSIADRLNAEGVPTKRGGQWQPTTTRNLYLRNKAAG